MNTTFPKVVTVNTKEAYSKAYKDLLLEAERIINNVGLKTKLNTFVPSPYTNGSTTYQLLVLNLDTIHPVVDILLDESWTILRNSLGVFFDGPFTINWQEETDQYPIKSNFHIYVSVDRTHREFKEDIVYLDICPI